MSDSIVSNVSIDVVLEQIKGIRETMDLRFTNLEQKIDSAVMPIQQELHMHIQSHAEYSKRVSEVEKKCDNLEDRIIAAENTPAKRAQQILHWLGITFGGILAAGIVAVFIWGIIYFIQHVPGAPDASRQIQKISQVKS